MLTAGDALFVKARERFHDGRRTRNPGCSWTVYGPQAYHRILTFVLKS